VPTKFPEEAAQKAAFFVSQGQYEARAFPFFSTEVRALTISPGFIHLTFPLYT